MKPLLILSALLCLAVVPVRADDHDDDDGPGEAREVEVIRGPRGGGGGDGPGRRMRDDDDDGPRGGGMGGKHGRGGHKGGFGREMDPAMKERMEKMRAAQDKVRELTQKLRKAKDSEKAALKKDARVALGELFDARLAMEQSMVDKMSEHLAEKKEKLAKKKAAKDKLVDEKLDKLTGDAPSWDD